MKATSDPFTPALAVPAGFVMEPTFERHGDEYVMAWTAPPVTMTLSSVRAHSDGLAAELAVAHGPAEIHWGRLSLSSTSARETVVKKPAVCERICGASPLPEKSMHSSASSTCSFRGLPFSSRLKSKDSIRVASDGNVVILQGTVTNDHERRLAESLVRLTPGVRQVRNELQVRGAAPIPLAVP